MPTVALLSVYGGASIPSQQLYSLQFVALCCV
jgi:hypothetical protein